MNMSAPADHAGAPLPARRALLFTGGRRLGWQFRDRMSLSRPFPEPEPDRAAFWGPAQQRAANAQRAYRRSRPFGGVSIGCGGLFLLFVIVSVSGYWAGPSSFFTLVVLGFFTLVVFGTAPVVMIVLRQRARQAAAVQPDLLYQRELAAWRQRYEEWHQSERARLDGVIEWGHVGAARRTDIFGGGVYAQEALLTTHGTSVLAEKPLLLIDLTGDLVCRELTEVARAAGVPVNAWLLPSDLSAAGVLAGLSSAQFADALAESMHAGAQDGARTDRAVDTRVLDHLHTALGGDVTPVRLLAAVRAALGTVAADAAITPQEQSVIAGQLFPEAYRKQVTPNLVRIEAFLADLARYAPHDTAPRSPADPAYFTCLAAEPGARSARGELLTALIIQWLTVQVTRTNADTPAVIVAGADEITRPHLERLAAACERARVPLTFVFKHLRDDALDLAGGAGATGFMRLGNHREAEQAATLIGKGHRFTLSSFTSTLGGNETHTITETEGYSVTDTIGITHNTGWNTGQSRGWSKTGGGIFGLGEGSDSHSGSVSDGRSGGEARSRSRATSRNWSTAVSWAEGTNWSNAAGTQRVYEYFVEPTELQNLPDHALLLLTQGQGGPELRTVECDPAIITLPRSSIQPLPPLSQAAPPNTQAIAPAPYRGDPLWRQPPAAPGHQAQQPNPHQYGPHQYGP